MKTFLAAGLAAAALAGCGAAEPVGTTGRDGARMPDGATRPHGEPPDAGAVGGDAPPPAWIETRHGSTWLGYASFCWETTCADAVPPECGKPHSPYVDVDPGEPVTFRLAFRPTTATIVYFSGAEGASRSAETERLEPGRSITWLPSREAPFWLSTRAGGGSDASYAACLRFASDPLTVEEALARGSGRVTVRGTLYVEGAEVRLCDGLAESHPPQCSGRYLVVTGSELPLDDLRREGETAWGEAPVTLGGRLEGSTLAVAER